MRQTILYLNIFSISFSIGSHFCMEESYWFYLVLANPDPEYYLIFLLPDNLSMSSRKVKNLGKILCTCPQIQTAGI